jgi:hypothetical protein
MSLVFNHPTRGEIDVFGMVLDEFLRRKDSGTLDDDPQIRLAPDGDTVRILPKEHGPVDGEACYTGEELRRLSHLR